MIAGLRLKTSATILLIPFICLLSIMVAITVMVAWFLDIRVLVNLGYGQATMKFNTAIGFLFSAISMFGAYLSDKKKWMRILAQCSGILTLAIGLLTLIEYISGVDFGIDQAFFRDALTSIDQFPGRMAIATAVGFTILSSCILLILTEKKRMILLAQCLALILLVKASVALVGYLLAPTSLHAMAWYQSEAIHTASLFMLLSIAVLMLKPHAGIVEPIASPLLGGHSARILLPVTILLPVFSGWILMSCINVAILDSAMAMDIFVVLNVLIISTLVWIHAWKKNGIHSNLLKQNELLSRSEQNNSLLAAIVTSTRDAIICLDQKDQITVWNFGAEHIFGVSSSNALGQHSSQILPASLLDKDWLRQAREMQTDASREFSLSRRDGQSIEVSITISPVRNSQGDVIGISIIGHDITSIRAIESERDVALRDLVDFKTALDEHAIVAITDSRGRITYVNDKFCAISKYTREELMGKDHRIVNSGNHSKVFFKELWSTISQGHVWHGEIQNLAKDGDFYWVDTTIVPFLDEDGRPRQYVAIRTDVTELVRSAAALARQTEELSRSNADLEQFAYIASHDLQEPLRGIEGCVQLLSKRHREHLDDQGQTFIDHTIANVSRMQCLIRDLLAYSRVGSQNLKFQTISLVDVLNDAKLSLSSVIAECNADIKNDDLPSIYGDRTQLRQVFQNLLSNALKFRREDPVIHIGAQLIDGNWDIAFTDNGIGINQEFFERIFVIFQRLHGRAEYNGTGIGLALCKRIIQHHGGRIWVESELDKGTVFHVVLRATKELTDVSHLSVASKEDLVK